MIKKHAVSLIIPCRNEEDALSSLLQQIPPWIDEVLVVDNLSTDRTSRIARDMGCRVIHEKREINGIGYGFAHLSGIREAKGDILIAIDGDSTYPIQSLKPAIMKFTQEGLDFLMCDRYPLKNKGATSLVRRIGVWILNNEASFILRKPISDILSGSWIIKKALAKDLSLESGGWNLSPEIKIKALFHNINVSKYHINYKPRLGDSKQKIWQTGVAHAFYILMLSLSLYFKGLVGRFSNKVLNNGFMVQVNN